jgi:hypothetical protein
MLSLDSCPLGYVVSVRVGLCVLRCMLETRYLKPSSTHCLRCPMGLSSCSAPTMPIGVPPCVLQLQHGPQCPSECCRVYCSSVAVPTLYKCVYCSTAAVTHHVHLITDMLISACQHPQCPSEYRRGYCSTAVCCHGYAHRYHTVSDLSATLPGTSCNRQTQHAGPCGCAKAHAKGSAAGAHIHARGLPAIPQLAGTLVADTAYQPPGQNPLNLDGNQALSAKASSIPPGEYARKSESTAVLQYPHCIDECWRVYCSTAEDCSDPPYPSDYRHVYFSVPAPTMSI